MFAALAIRPISSVFVICSPKRITKGQIDGCVKNENAAGYLTGGAAHSARR
jgi:hypothetical protein